MNYKIFKYKLDITDMQSLDLPIGSDILSVVNQDNTLVLYAFVNTDQPKEKRHIEIIGTGNPIDKDMVIYREFIGTVVMSGPVWHVFERIY